MTAAPSSIGPQGAAALWSSVRRLLPTYADVRLMGKQPWRDFIAGVTVATVALPLALAFGISSGLSAEAGLVTAIVAGLVAALLGGSNLQVSGPTGAMAVVLVPIVAQYGPGGVLVVGLMAGVLLVALGFLRAGRFMRFVPLPVVEGFTVGIAVIIALQQVPAALGVPGDGEKVLAVAGSSLRTFVAEPAWPSLALAMAVTASMLIGVRLRPGLPVSLIAVIAATVIATLTDLQVATIGTIPRSLPAPSLPDIPTGALGSLLVPAAAVAALAALESLLSATVADGMTVGSRHDPDRELFGQGMANLVTPLFGGMPATAAIARTAVNVRTGARSRLAAITHSLTLLVTLLVAATWVAKIPLAALAGVLIATAIQMVEVSSVRALLRSTRGDAIVLTLTATATVAFDLVTAVILGLLASGIHALAQVAGSAQIGQEKVSDDTHTDEERELLDEHVVAYRLDGPLFFGAAHAFLLELTEVSDISVVILRMSRVHSLDATGARVLGDTITGLERRDVTVLLSGTKSEHLRLLNELGALDTLAHENHAFATTPQAITHARSHLARRTSPKK